MDTSIKKYARNSGDFIKYDGTEEGIKEVLRFINEGTDKYRALMVDMTSFVISSGKGCSSPASWEQHGHVRPGNYIFKADGRFIVL